MKTSTRQHHHLHSHENQRTRLALTLTLFLVLAPFSANFNSENSTILRDDVDYRTSNSTATDAEIEMLLSGMNTSEIPEVVGVVDANSNFQLVWINSTNYAIVFAMFDQNGAQLIAPTNLPQSSLSNIPMDIVIDIDSTGILYICWSDMSNIYGLAINAANDDHDGSQANGTQITTIPPTSLVYGVQSRYDPDIVIDRFDAIHLVWVDEADPLGQLYNIPQIHYMMTTNNNGAFTTVIGSTFVTATLSNSGNPAISMGSNDTVVIVWQDTSGSLVEYIGILDTSGSMSAEWADMCSVFYGGTFTSGSTFMGIKPLMNSSGITVLETLYALAGQGGLPSATTGPTCAAAVQTGGNGNQGPRATHLGQNPSDTSGGIRWIENAIFDGQSIDLPPGGGGTNDGSEDWGPGTTWACLSWRDSQGRLGNAANPPTPADHRWNPNASKFVIPVSDEGPKNGEPSQQTDDYATINEAHDACVMAGVIPMPLLATGFSSGSDPVGSHMMDLALCHNGITSNVQRTCPGTTLRNTDAGGMVYQFPTSSSGQAQMTIMVQAILNQASASGTTEIFMTVLDPYSFFNNPRSGWSIGAPGSDTTNSEYREYVGPSIDSEGYGNLVIVNDTRVTETSGYSTDADVVVDDLGDIHITWSDYRSGFVTDEFANSQLNYARIDPDRAGENDGSPLDMDQTAIISPSSIASSNLSWASKPVIGLDSRGVNIAWFEFDESVTDLRWVILSDEVEDFRQSISQSVYEVYNDVSTIRVASGYTSMMGFGGSSLNGSQPIVSFDYPQSNFFWTDEDCEGDGSSANSIQLCTRSIIDYSIGFERTGNSGLVTISPDEYVAVLFELDAGFIPGAADELTISHSLFPSNWLVDVGFRENSFLRESISVSTGSVIPIELLIRSPTLRLSEQNLTFDIEVIITSLGFDSISESQIVTIDFFNLNGFDDDDNDGVLDSVDSCPWGEYDWISDEFSDYDNDGCKDATEDLDDDEDGVLDEDDNCPKGTIGPASSDLDQDGCDDSTEDIDLDEDGILNLRDDCPQGQMYWNPSLDDHDNDGCADSTEDLNDDNDPYLDAEDDCPTGEVGWQFDGDGDHDLDGCFDISEDKDDDNDGVSDSIDDCQRGQTDWESNSNSDYDGDGCADFSEDSDFDNDGIGNSEDLCPFSYIVGIASSPITDWDSDGCVDESEDLDDDNDGFSDEEDSCIRSDLSSTVDLDSDGCMDYTEDDDLDNDGVLSVQDNCESNPLISIISSPETDFDGDGCMDEYEDLDDDNDGILDELDQCQMSKFGIQSIDTDSDGCLDDSEDLDNDNDGIPNEDDNCPSGQIGWISEKSNDIDGDGCLDAIEDTNIEYSILDRIEQNIYPLTAALAGIMLLFIGRFSARVTVKKERPVKSTDLTDQSKLWDEEKD